MSEEILTEKLALVSNQLKAQHERHLAKLSKHVQSKLDSESAKFLQANEPPKDEGIEEKLKEVKKSEKAKFDKKVRAVKQEARDTLASEDFKRPFLMEKKEAIERKSRYYEEKLAKMAAQVARSRQLKQLTRAASRKPIEESMKERLASEKASIMEQYYQSRREKAEESERKTQADKEKLDAKWQLKLANESQA